MTESAPVKLAWQSIKHYLEHGTQLPIPSGLSSELCGQAGVFVSLKKNGELRGCIGTFAPTRESVAAEIIANAISAAMEDPRFWPVAADELPELIISVDILSAPERVDSLTALDPKRYGVIVKRGRRSGLLLPDLEGVDTIEDQVSIAMSKAGIDPHEQIDLYRAALVKEQESVELYKQLKKDSQQQEEKVICELLLHEEEKHAEVIGNIIEMLNHVNDWVEAAEFNHQDAY